MIPGDAVVTCLWSRFIFLRYHHHNQHQIIFSSHAIIPDSPTWSFAAPLTTPRLSEEELGWRPRKGGRDKTVRESEREIKGWSIGETSGKWNMDPRKWRNAEVEDEALRARRWVRRDARCREGAARWVTVTKGTTHKAGHFSHLAAAPSPPTDSLSSAPLNHLHCPCYLPHYSLCWPS